MNRLLDEMKALVAIDSICLFYLLAESFIANRRRISITALIPWATLRGIFIAFSLFSLVAKIGFVSEVKGLLTLSE